MNCLCFRILGECPVPPPNADFTFTIKFPKSPFQNLIKGYKAFAA